MTGRIIQGDCLDVMPALPSESVDLIVTSPPYADLRKERYGGPLADEYVDWFLPRATEMMRALKPRGSLVLNIKECIVDGERSEYVYDLVRAMRKRGWRWIDDFCWNKIAPTPGRWPNRLKDGWEHMYHLAPTLRPALYHESVMFDAATTTKRIADWVKRKNPGVYQSPSNRRKIERWRINPSKVLPSNTLFMNVENSHMGHEAAFPLRLPEFFIRLLSKSGDLVLDPFCGSGTTCVAAARLGREYVGIDLYEKYCGIARRRIAKAQTALAEST